MVALWYVSCFLLGFLSSVSGCFLRCFPFPLLHGAQPRLFSLLSFEVAFGLCGVCSFCSIWCLLLFSSPFRGPLFLRWPFPSVLLLPLSQGACRSFSFSLSLFGSKVSLRVGVCPFGRGHGSSLLFLLLSVLTVYCSSFVFGWLGSTLSFAGGCCPSFCILFGCCAYFPSSRSSLGFFVLSFLRFLPWAVVSCFSGYGQCVLFWVSLTPSRHTLVLQAVSSSACSSFYLLSCGPVSVGSSLLFLTSFSLRALPAVICCCLPFRVVALLAFLSGEVDVWGSPSSSFIVSVPRGDLMLPSG